MTRNIYFYKLTTDNNGAPCVYGKPKLLSLAICKPMIRKKAKKGDLIFGFAARSLSPDNRLIYVARITDRLDDGAYYKNKQYFRRPDCIYRFSDSKYFWRDGSKYHGPNDLEHDLGKYPAYDRATVLLSSDFRYLGKAGTSEYKKRFKLVASAIDALARGSRLNHDRNLREELEDMETCIFRKINLSPGSPTTKPSRNFCLRDESERLGICGAKKPSKHPPSAPR